MLETRSGAGAGLLRDRGGRCRVAVHAELTVGLSRGVEQCLGAATIASTVTGVEHPRIIALGVSQPGASAHPRVQLEGGIEVELSLLPACQGRGEQSEVA